MVPPGVIGDQPDVPAFERFEIIPLEDVDAVCYRVQRTGWRSASNRGARDLRRCCITARPTEHRRVRRRGYRAGDDRSDERSEPAVASLAARMHAIGQ